MSEDTRVRVVAREPVRCSICHGDLDATSETCAGCGTSCHADCRAQHGRCPTLGCGAAVPGVAPETTPRLPLERPTRPSFARAAGVSVGTAILLGLIALATAVTFAQPRQRFGPHLAVLTGVVALAHFVLVPAWWARRLVRSATFPDPGGPGYIEISIKLGLLAIVATAVFGGACAEATSVGPPEARRLLEILAILAAIAAFAIGPTVLAWLTAWFASPSRSRRPR